MIDKEILEQTTSLHKEIEDLENRLERIKNKKLKIVQDSVKGSGTSYPYIQHSCTIEGIEYPKKNKSVNTYKRQIKSKSIKLGKLINKIEYELNYISNSEIRRIIRYRYEDNLSWLQIMHEMNYNSEEAARIQLKRFFEKN